MVEKETLDVESINVIAVVTNMAGLAITKNYTVSVSSSGAGLMNAVINCASGN